jgi:ectoine hydroxylase-related dioxygenase (phytanoyl-CoA dioxygenase family)
MDQEQRDELDRLRAEVKTLRAQLSAVGLDARLADRDREFRQRITSLENVASHIASEGGRVDAQAVRLLGLVKRVATQVHTQGYVIVPDLLDSTQVERLRNAMAPLFAATGRMFRDLDPGGARQTIHIHNVLAKSRAADEVALNPLLRAIIRCVLGHDFILNAGAIAMSPDPGCSPQGLHRDDGHYPFPPRPRLPLVVTAAIALDDFTKANGGTQIVPGSCCWPDSRHPDAGEIIYCEMTAGSMLLWDGAIFHGGGGNATKDQSRRTLVLNYARGWLRTQFNQYLSIPRSLVLSMPPELQRDLGYHLDPHGLGVCDSQAPLDYLRRMVSNGGDGAQPMLGREIKEQSAM